MWVICMSLYLTCLISYNRFGRIIQGGTLKSPSVDREQRARRLKSSLLHTGYHKREVSDRAKASLFPKLRPKAGSDDRSTATDPPPL
ncbi:hypothetical protein CGCF415_v008140 [Colletotrichum fructicola]|uniref:Uncharacterized protein n=1 Tax=Colletotrichum fructicola (strain Nara gc5) TaxID=1213859 RepID=A0A7J6JLR4_COLFN|nr:hypothetical protein CGGC5_v001115 [Colletotrichum fructicola Nara gc5]KAF4898317.1 hypothetical protein CGCFRS4_v004533 [Colletotrichum fructicola]KAF4905703.1 hypothetical protein CGCF415_v008140 [Colletotrichum fructicola]KAF4938000.1 hypothetical protein CGCF245_v005090 [Colletotrichum fructicola]